MAKKPFNLHNHIERQLRKIWQWWPPRTQCRNEARRWFEDETGRVELYECAKCHKNFTRKETAVDHIKPVIELHGFVGWDRFIKRLFCEVGNLQVLCKGCHKEKTNDENRKRRFDWRTMK